MKHTGTEVYNRQRAESPRDDQRDTMELIFLIKLVAVTVAILIGALYLMYKGIL